MRIAVLSLVAACGSVTTYQSADTLPPGRWQGMAALALGSYDDVEMHQKTPTIVAEIGARRGVADNTDVGLKLYTLGIEASVRQRLTTGTWSWALLGALGGLRTGPGNTAIPEALLFQLRLGAVATRRTSGSFAWNMGPLVTGSLWIPAGGGSAAGAMLGAFGGFDWRFGARWHLIPELTLHRSVAGDVPVDGTVGELGAAFARDW